MKTLTLVVDADGIALITLDDPSKPMNVVSPEFIEEFSAAVERVADDPLIKGAVVTSAKPSFMAGADLKYILALMERGIDVHAAAEFGRKPQAMHRRMESCGKPFVAAINGLALGGGFELCLACHRRVIVDNPKATVGLPEVTVGLLPGSGGTQRLPRMIGLERALAILLDARTQGPTEALSLGLVDEVVPAEQLLSRARQVVLGLDPVRPWDQKGYRANAGLLSPETVAIMSMRPAQVAAQTQCNYPAPSTILSCVFEGIQMPIDKALALETKYFARLLASPVARNIVRTTFVSKGEAGKLARRPKDIPPSRVVTLGVLGAGMMGSGIAYVAAVAGVKVVLLDTSTEQAEKGRAYSARLLDKAVEKGRQSRAGADEILNRIQVATEYRDLSDCDLVVEAVFEDVAIKADVTAKAEAAVREGTLIASNTSTLPISELARASQRPGQFIGLHFFSPVDRMPLVEVIVGRETSPATLAKSLDFVQQLRMTPIVVNDSRGFYTSRVFQTFIHEGMKMLEDGIEPARIENAARGAGFPVGPLALLDEVTIELPWKITKEAEVALGAKFVKPCAYEVMRRMLEELQRPGRRYGKGFYEYAADGGKALWSGLAQAFPRSAEQPSSEELKQRFLYVQALETARCLEEGVITHPADGDVGSLLAWGFPAWTGGTLSYIDTVGTADFVAEAERLAAAYGPRFAPSAWLKDRARRGVRFY